jgi:predicted transcriptional regulator
MKIARKSITITARVTPEVARLLNNYTRAFRHTRSSAVQSILEQFLDYDNWVVKEIEEGVASAKKGPMIPHKEAMKVLKEHIRKAKQRKRRKKA